MTIAERNNKLKQFITCLKCEVSGKPCDGNCSKNYEVGNMGEIIENLEAISKALEQEPIIDKIRAEIDKIYEREGNSIDCLNALDELKWFIDKYKAEKGVRND